MAYTEVEWRGREGKLGSDTRVPLYRCLTRAVVSNHASVAQHQSRFVREYPHCGPVTAGTKQHRLSFLMSPHSPCILQCKEGYRRFVILFPV